MFDFAPDRPPAEWRAAFAHRVSKHGNCWLFTGACGPNGYGHLGYQRTNWTAHRLSYALFYDAPIPTGRIIMHTCDTPACIRPGHLRVGTYSDNTRDMIAKRRHGWVTKPERFSAIRPPAMYGEQNPSARLTQKIVSSIRGDRAGGSTYSELMAKYGLAKTTVADIVKRRTWRTPGRTAEEIATAMEAAADRCRAAIEAGA